MPSTLIASDIELGLTHLDVPGEKENEEVRRSRKSAESDIAIG